MPKNATEIPAYTKSDASGVSADSSRAGEFMPAMVARADAFP
jgi:hypothetical protein